MNKALAETLKLLLNNQKLLADQISSLNDKVKALQQSQGHRIIKAHAVKKSSKTTLLDEDTGTIH